MGQVGEGDLHHTGEFTLRSGDLLQCGGGGIGLIGRKYSQWGLDIISGGRELVKGLARAKRPKGLLFGTVRGVELL